MLGTLDPLGMPLATLVVPGETADDGLYLPLVEHSRAMLGAGYLYVGDNKMSALSTRATLHADGDYYLTALPRTGNVPQLLEALLEPVWGGEQPLSPVYKRQPYNERADRRLQALVYETERPQKAEVGGQTVAWQERLLVVYSPSLAKRGRRGLAQRLQNAEEALLALTPPRGRGRKQWQDLEALERKVAAILKRHRVQGLLAVDYHLEVERWSVRAYGDRPARTEERHRYLICVRRKREAISQAARRLGWRLYVSNAPAVRRPADDAVRTYRSAPTIERGFRRLKGHPLGLPPLYVQREDHAQGMVRLLTLGLRVLTLVEHVVRDALVDADETLAGLYPANPKRETARPTTERLLQAFKELTLTIVRLPEQVICHLTPLTDLQRRILALLQLPVSLYDDLVAAVQQKSIMAQNLEELSPAAITLLESLVDGAGLYALPMELNIEGFWYNEAVFAENNIEVPTTWDELMTAAETLHANGIQPFAVAGAESLPITRLINAYVVRYYGTDVMARVVDGELEVTDAGFIEAAQVVQDMAEAGYFGRGVTTIDYATGIDQFSQGRAAMLYMGSWTLRDFNDPETTPIGADNIGLFNIPLVEGGEGTLDQWSWKTY